MNSTPPPDESGVLTIAQLGDPILTHSIPEFVGFKNPPELERLRQLAAKMMKTLHQLNLQGLAAPQVSSQERMFVISTHATPLRPDVANPMSAVVVNPRIIKASSEMEVALEGCGSIPGLYAPVLRPTWITVKFVSLLPDGEKDIHIDLANFNARVFLHEFDHLNGILFLSRVTNWANACMEMNLDRVRQQM